MTLDTRPICPHCQCRIPWRQVCGCAAARAARLKKKAERERLAELRRIAPNQVP
ncbi:hypothetical protein [Deinococcus marmoris]|uniref:Uncharacterized protein n=1 Tax=Deinococcus marmoris TaxID=249408 RepID=A0A1U7P4V3_9DEIO|nr:hypothetical protein [Deinococcus marmoris]OLV20201.1 hypothetical protein BOO71_0000631 [Deinococcus marmoris]